ncbi:LINE-1 reverse transcriptase [Solea senegalensis]|uniref:LINE-1 reverse transcriptase n=1 Tax=Solea senegalensis TaxID=28829 RepID=A0AAV6RDW1_SOLSE|nr:LINE-1 reverse transcriptase [Solea senegalensis]
MATGTRLAKERETVRDDSTTMDSQISMPALTSLLEHRRSISAALSTELGAAFISLEAKLDTVQVTVKKVDTERMVWLLDQIVSIDTQYAAAPTPSLYDQRLKFQAEFISCQHLRLKQNFFEMGDKAGKLLAHQARTAALSRLIPRIKLSSGTVVTDPKLLNDAFLNFYSDLYTSEYSPEVWKSHNPLEMFSYPKVDSSLSDKLGTPITTAEVQEAIGQLQSGKSMGPDGFVVEFYKAYSILITPHLVNVYNESFDSSSLPPTLSEANISLLLKKRQRPLEFSNYRPISHSKCGPKDSCQGPGLSLATSPTSPNFHGPDWVHGWKELLI